MGLSRHPVHREMRQVQALSQTLLRLQVIENPFLRIQSLKPNWMWRQLDAAPQANAEVRNVKLAVKGAC